MPLGEKRVSSFLFLPRTALWYKIFVVAALNLFTIAKSKPEVALCGHALVFKKRNHLKTTRFPFVVPRA